MSIVTSIFSALGNNSSLYPIIFKDSIDNGARTVMAYQEGAKNGKEYGLYDARERFIDENVTSVVWIGGIPTLKLLYDKLVTNKVYKFSNYKELGSTFDKEGARVMADTNVKLLDGGLQSLEKNITELRSILETKKSPILEKMLKDAESILADKAKFKRIYAGKMAFASLVPLATIGFILPKLIQKLTKSIYRDNSIIKEQQAKKMAVSNFTSNSPRIFASFAGHNNKNDKDVSFKGSSIGNILIDLFNNDVSNQALLDGGIFAGRVATGVNLADKIEKAIKEIGVIFFIYFGGSIVGGMLEKLAKGLGMPIDLDSQILENSAFKDKIASIAKSAEKEKELAGLFEFPEHQAETFKSLFAKKSQNPDFQQLNIVAKIKAVKAELAQINEVNEKKILDFIDDQIKHGLETVTEEKAGKKVETAVFQNATLKIAQKLGVIELIDGVKNPLQYIDAGKVKGLNESLKDFVKKAMDAKDVDNFLKHSVATKRIGILANLAICTIATAYVLPKLQYKFRENFTKSSNLPSLETYDQEIKAERFAGKMA